MKGGGGDSRETRQWWRRDTGCSDPADTVKTGPRDVAGGEEQLSWEGCGWSRFGSREQGLRFGQIGSKM